MLSRLPRRITFPRNLWSGFASLGILVAFNAGCGGHSDGMIPESDGYTYESVAEQIRAEDAANEAARKELEP